MLLLTSFINWESADDDNGFIGLHNRYVIRAFSGLFFYFKNEGFDRVVAEWMKWRSVTTVPIGRFMSARKTVNQPIYENPKIDDYASDGVPCGVTNNLYSCLRHTFN